MDIERICIRRIRARLWGKIRISWKNIHPWVENIFVEGDIVGLHIPPGVRPLVVLVYHHNQDLVFVVFVGLNLPLNVLFVKLSLE